MARLVEGLYGANFGPLVPLAVVLVLGCHYHQCFYSGRGLREINSRPHSTTSSRRNGEPQKGPADQDAPIAPRTPARAPTQAHAIPPGVYTGIATCTAVAFLDKQVSSSETHEFQDSIVFNAEGKLIGDNGSPLIVGQTVIGGTVQSIAEVGNRLTMRFKTHTAAPGLLSGAGTRVVRFRRINTNTIELEQVVNASAVVAKTGSLIEVSQKVVGIFRKD